MGFSHELATEALFHATTIEQATDYLLSNPTPFASLRVSNVSPVIPNKTRLVNLSGRIVNLFLAFRRRKSR